MKTYPTLLLSLLTFSLCQAEKQKDEGFVSLFDGKTLDGWEGKKEFFRVENGAIVAGFLDKKVPHNEFLVSKKAYGDFELRFEAKLVGQGNNAGVQFRSERIPNHNEMIGYQCDIGSWSKGTIWGFLYDESRRRKMLAQAPQEKVNSWVKPRGEWNKLVVHAKGPVIKIWLNGKQTVDFTESQKEIPLTGKLGLQIHGGPPLECHYRKIQIKNL
jgi:hypothetical protein